MSTPTKIHPFSIMEFSPPPKKRNPSVFSSPLFKKGVEKVANEVAEVAGFVLIGVISLVMFPTAASPLFVYSGTTLCARLTLLAAKSLDPYHLRWLAILNRKVMQITEKYPYIQMITFIFSIAVAYISSTLSTASAIALGLFNAIVIEVVRSKQMLEIRREERKRPDTSLRAKIFDS